MSRKNHTLGFLVSGKLTSYKLQCNYKLSLKGLGHAILGNFSTDQMVIELTKI